MDATDAVPARAARQVARSRPDWLRRFRVWHRRTILGPFDPGVILDRIHEDAHWSGRYAFMTAMSAGIAILGLLLSSPAVIIGAMLISPLMGPIVGLGFELATIDWLAARKSLLALAGGALLAVFFCWLIVILSPLQDMTAEIAARTRPTLFDLLVAVFSGLAGGYATVRGRGEAIVGVAIATALMPPLAVVGFGIATRNMPVLSGSFALFLTNFLAISLSAALVARFYGFGSALAPRQTRWQLAAMVLLTVALATPLAVSLHQIAWEALATRTMRSVINQEFGGSGHIVSLDPDFAGQRIRTRVTVLTDRYHDKAKTDLERVLDDRLQRPVTLELNQLLVNQQDVQTELDRIRNREALDRQDRVARADMAARLSLVTGAPVTEVLVDPVARIAYAPADRRQTLAQMMDTEQRLNAASPGWEIRLQLPAGLFPAALLPGEDGDRDHDLDAIVWGLGRLGTNRARIEARRQSAETRSAAVARLDKIAKALTERGLTVEVAPLLAIDRAAEQKDGRAAAGAVRVVALAPPVEEEQADAGNQESAAPAPERGAKRA